MVQDDASFFFQLREDVLEAFTGTIIDNDAVGKAGILKIFGICDQTVIRLQRGDQNRRMEKLLTCHGKPPYL